MDSSGGGGGAPARGEGVRFSDAVAGEIIGRVTAGESLASISRDGRMPSGTAIREWRYTRPDFGAALSAAQRRARLARRRMDLALAAERLIRPRRYGPDRCTYAPEVGEAICTRLANGESLLSICEDEEMPAPATVYGWLRRHPDFADAYAQARQFHADYLFDEAREVALSATAGNVSARRLHFDIIRWQAARGAPDKYCERMLTEEIQSRAQPMTVIVKRFTDHPDQTAEEREALRRGRVAWSNQPGVKPGDLMPE